MHFKLFLILCYFNFSMASAETKTKRTLPEDSLYHIGSQWVNQDGQKILLKDISGKPTLLSLVYLSCQYLCPTIISEVQSIESKLSDDIKNKIQIVLVSFDPEKDTPQVMKAYREKRNLPPSRWMFITNKNEGKIRELAAALNFKYQKIEKGDFTHSFMIIALDKNGVIKSRIDGANKDPKELIETLSGLSGM